MPGRAKVDMENDRQQEDIFLFREPKVLLTIICLSLSRGITMVLQESRIKDDFPTSLFIVYSLSTLAVPMIGTVFFAFLSEIHGRKPIFIALYILSIISPLLYLIPWHYSVIFTFPVHGFVKGGILIMCPLAITEYCSPKHRFTYLMFNALLLHTVHTLTTILLSLEARSYPYVQAFHIVLIMPCLVSARKWPESPYWLASQGRFEDSREAFLWLRGEEGREELNSVMAERRTPGPLKLYWLSFFVVVATISVAVFTNIGNRFWRRWGLYPPKDLIMENVIRLCGSIVIAVIVSVVSYFVKRKVLFLLVSGVSIVLSYAIVIWMHVDPSVEDPSNQVFYYAFFTSTVISTYGTMVFGTILFAELVPLKYNTHMLCAGWLCNYIIYFPGLTFFLEEFSNFEKSHVFLPLFTTLSVVGLIVYYCFAPETKDKTLLEIQKLYTPEISEVNVEEDDEIMTHI